MDSHQFVVPVMHPIFDENVLLSMNCRKRRPVQSGMTPNRRLAVG